MGSTAYIREMNTPLTLLEFGPLLPMPAISCLVLSYCACPSDCLPIPKMAQFTTKIKTKMFHDGPSAATFHAEIGCFILAVVYRPSCHWMACSRNRNRISYVVTGAVSILPNCQRVLWHCCVFILRLATFAFQNIQST